MRLERADLWPERDNLRPKTADFRLKRTDLRPERLNMRPESPDLRPQRPSFKPERLKGVGRMNQWTNGQTDKQMKVPLPKNY